MRSVENPFETIALATSSWEATKISTNSPRIGAAMMGRMMVQVADLKELTIYFKGLRNGLGSGGGT